MPVNGKRAVFKTALLAPGGALIGWAVQQVVTGDLFVGGAGLLVGVLMIGGFVLLEEYDIPYEEEIANVLEKELQGYSQEEVTEIARNVSQRLGEEVEDRSENN